MFSRQMSTYVQSKSIARPFLAQVGLILFWPGLAVWAVWLLNVTGAL